MNRLWLSCFFAGLILCFAFGSLALALLIYDQASTQIATQIQAEGERVFVRIKSAQKKETPGGATSFYYSYEGPGGTQKIEASERVDSRLFHSSSEGKNIEALAYGDPAGTTHVRLRENREPYGKRLAFLREVCLYATLLGLALATAGGLPILLSRRIRKNDSARTPPVS